MASISIVIEGVKYNTIKDAAKKYKVHAGNAARRLKSGWTPAEAFELAPKPKRQANNGKLIKTSQGVFSSIADAAAHFGLKNSTVQNRLKLGWSADQAVGLGPPPETNATRIYNAVTCDGKVYKSVAELARVHGKSGRLVAGRLRAGWTPEQAVELNPAPPRFRDYHGHARNHLWKMPTNIDGKILPGSPEGVYRLYTIKNNINGKEYIGITTNDIRARLRGHRGQVKRGTKGKLYNAMRHYGSKHFSIHLIRDDAKDFAELQEQEIIEIKKRETLRNGYNTAIGGGIGTSEPITIDGKHFPSRQSAAEYYGVEVSLFNIRISKLGWTPEEAADLVKREFQRHELKIAGKTYRSLSSAAKDYGLSYHTVYNRVLRSGWKYEQALGIEPPPEDALSNLPQTVEAFGKTYPSKSEFARAFEVDPESLRLRLKKGQDAETAIREMYANKGWRAPK